MAFSYGVEGLAYGPFRRLAPRAGYMKHSEDEHGFKSLVDKKVKTK